MAKAFPGLRGIEWYNNPSEAVRRLELLLVEPLMFKEGSQEFEADPIWWFRGGSAMYIKAFKRLNKEKVLINFDQLKIKRIAAYHGDSYYKDFVYVETYAEKPTGIYGTTNEDIKRHIQSFGFSWEEYGLISSLHYWKKPIRREQYEDGATIVRGKVVKTPNAELRIRYLSGYNFIIAAKGSPYNSGKFESGSQNFLNGILAGTVNFDEFFNFLKMLKKGER